MIETRGGEKGEEKAEAKGGRKEEVKNEREEKKVKRATQKGRGTRSPVTLERSP